MKRLLLLFIPLVFFFGCEEDAESESNDCSCGEVFAQDYVPAYAGAYVMILDEDYSGLHPIIKVLIYYKKGFNKNEVGLWSIRSFERWEIFSETR